MNGKYVHVLFFGTDKMGNGPTLSRVSEPELEYLLLPKPSLYHGSGSSLNFSYYSNSKI